MKRPRAAWPLLVVAATALAAAPGCSTSTTPPGCEAELIETSFDDFVWEPVSPPPEAPLVTVDGLTIVVTFGADVIRTIDCAGANNWFTLEADGTSLELVQRGEQPDGVSCSSMLIPVTATIEVCEAGDYELTVGGETLAVAVE